MKYLYTERYGGAEIQAGNLARELARRGHHISFICNSLHGKRGVEKIDGCEVRWLPDRKNLDVLNGWSVYRHLRDIRPDVVYQRYTNFYSGIAAWYAKRHGVPFIWNCTDNSVLLRWNKTKRELNAMRRSKRYRKLLLMPLAVIEDCSSHYGIRHAELHIVQNEIQQGQLESRLGVRGRYLPSGWDPATYRPGLKSQPPVILWVGDLGESKRPEKFIEIANGMRESGYKFILVGDTRSFRRKELVSSLLMGANVTYVDQVPPGEIYRFFCQASVFVDTSVEERTGFPNTFIQAWMAGVPVVSLGTDPDALLSSKKLGFVSASVRDAITTLHRFIEDKKELHLISERVAKFAVENHDINATADRFLSLLEEVFQARGMGGS